MKPALQSLDRRMRARARKNGQSVPEKAVLAGGQFAEHDFTFEVFGEKADGYAADVGAAEGVLRSNTVHLEAMGWTVLCIEPNPRYVKSLNKYREHVMPYACAERNADDQEFTVVECLPGNFEAVSALKPDPLMLEAMHDHRAHEKTWRGTKKIKVNVRTLDWCLEQAAFPRLDFLSIDVEGGEADVLAGFDIDRWRPKLIILEDWKGGQFRRWMCQHGYFVRARRGPNEVFIRA